MNLCFLGRVHPIKNLLWLLDAMATLKCECRLTIVGPIEDQQYYDQCQRAVNRLPSEIAVDFVGVKTEAEVRELLVAADAMILPTQGENFGQLPMQVVGDLGGRPQGEMAIGRPRSHRTVGLDGGMGGALIEPVIFDGGIGSRKSPWHIAKTQIHIFAKIVGAWTIFPINVMDQGGIGLEGLGRVEQGG